MAEKSSWFDSGFGKFVNNILFGLPSIIAGAIGSSHLTGAEREQNDFNAQQALLQREFEAEQAEKQMTFQSRQVGQQLAFQENMASTQYQRAVKDMQAAGINPALAMSNGGNAAPSGAAASGAMASGAAASGSGRGIPFNMSEIMAAMRMRSEMRLLDAQAKNVEEDTSLKESQRLRNIIEQEWLPRKYAAELDLNAQLIEESVAKVASLVASTEGQRLANEWNPQLWQSSLENDRVNREATVVGIQKVLEEINKLRAEESNLFEDTRIKQLTQGLVIAQTVLAQQNAREVSASAWRKEFENKYEEVYGHKPDQPVWNAVTSVLGEWSGKMREGAEGFKDLLSSAWHKATSYDPYSFGERHKE